MCNRKAKVCFMKLAVACLFLSFAAQFIGCLIPFWLHVEIDGNNISDVIYDLNGTEYNNSAYVNYNSGASDDETYYSIDESAISMFDNLNETKLNGTIENETEKYANRSFAIWFIQTCVNGVCQADLYPEFNNGSYGIQNYFDPGYNFSWVDSKVPFSRQREFQIELTLALVLTFINGILVWCHLRKLVQDIHGRTSGKCHLIRHCVSIVIIWLSGSLVWIPCMAYADVNINVNEMAANEITNGTEFSPVTVGTPYGLIFTWFSNLLTSLAFVFIFFTLSIRKKNNIEHRTDTITLNHIESGGGQGRHLVHSAPTIVLASESVPENVPLGDIFIGSCSYRDSIHANTQTDDDVNMYEEPPPSYEETMRLYKNTDASNMYYKERTNET